MPYRFTIGGGGCNVIRVCWPEIPGTQTPVSGGSNELQLRLGQKRKVTLFSCFAIKQTIHHSPTMRTTLRPTVIHRQIKVQKRWLSADPSPIVTTHYPAPHSGNIRVLLLDRPQSRNALSRRLVTDLRRHIQHIKDENGVGGTRALIVASGNDSSFCAGADLKERKGMSQEE